MLDNTKKTHFQIWFWSRFVRFKLDLYSAQSQELLSALENELELNKLIFLPKILILVSYSGEM